MPTRNVGPKGQVVIPKQMRVTLGMKPGVDIILEMRDPEIIIKKPQVTGSYMEYFVTTSSPKLKKTVNIRQLISNEVEKRHVNIDSNVFIYPILYPAKV